jgi:hypothetical protein
MTNALKDRILNFDFEENQKALAAHHARLAALYVPSDLALAVTEILKPLGFEFRGEFDPMDFDFDDYIWVEVEESAIAYTDTYIAVLNYSEMEYWELDNIESINLIETVEEAVRSWEES